MNSAYNASYASFFMLTSNKILKQETTINPNGKLWFEVLPSIRMDLQRILLAVIASWRSSVMMTNNVSLYPRMGSSFEQHRGTRCRWILAYRRQNRLNFCSTEPQVPIWTTSSEKAPKAAARVMCISQQTQSRQELLSAVTAGLSY